MPKATCRKCFCGITLVKTPVLALLELWEPSKYHGGFLDDLGETVKPLGPLIFLCSVLISLFVYPPLNQSPSSLDCLSSPTLHLFHFLFFMLAPSSGHPWLQKMPDSQAVPRPCLASSFLLLTHSTSGNNTQSAPFCFPALCVSKPSLNLCLSLLLCYCFI